jgi:hypothetical protein
MKTNRGGKRAGAGRPPLPPEAKSQNVRDWVWLTPAELAHIKALGNGNLSEGIRRLLKGEN